MPPVASTKRRGLIAGLQSLGFELQQGSDHLWMIRGSVRVKIPNPHEGDIGPNFLLRILKQAEVSRDEWEGV